MGQCDNVAIVLRNRGKRPFVATLYHGLYCAKGGPCKCKREEYDYAVGYAMARGKRVNPSSLTIFGGEEVKGLHEAVLSLPQVVDAIAKRTLIVSSSK
jgi:hypothetical protein